MAQRFLIALGAGLAAGTLFVLPAKGMLAGVWLSVLAPMPLMIACMGYGVIAGLGAALTGAFAAALMQPALGFVFLFSTAAPVLLLGWMSVHVFRRGRLSPGFLLMAVTALSVAAVWCMVAFFSFSYGGLDVAASELSATVQMILQNLKGVGEANNVMPVEEFAPLLVASMPAMMAFWSVLAGASRVVASCAAVALGAAFALQGLAAIHRLTADRQSRFAILLSLYAINFVLFPLPLFVMAGVGVADNVRPLRRLPATPSNPSNTP